MTARSGPRHIVVTGQPGNGKTTISQFIVQVFRAAVLTGAQNLGPGHMAIIEGVTTTLRELGRSLPRSRRWPLKIDLAKYAEEKGQVENETLLRYIAEQISARSQVGSITPATLDSWLKTWPWLLVLDGLDEVSEPSSRRRIIERVLEFCNNADGDNCDVLVVLTTRPVGYTENINPELFETVALDDLSASEAVQYAIRATKVRIGDDPVRVDKVRAALDAASKDENLRRLLRTPLQALILSIIVDGSGQVQPDRFSLFWNYYDTIFRREREKTTQLRSLLTKYGPQIQQLHERAGFALQQRSERADRSKATLTLDELRSIAWQVLKDAEYQPDGVDSGLLDTIMKTAMERLLLLAPHEQGYGFDVRSLQELMAALHLTNAGLAQTTARLRVAGPSPHWRNTWLFAAGKYFSAPEDHAHQAVVELVEQIDNGVAERLGDHVPVGPRLALDILDDGMARSWPKWRSRLLALALRAVTEPSPPDLARSMRILVRYADFGETEHRAVANGFREALGGSEVSRATVEAGQLLIPALEQEIGVDPRRQGFLASVKGATSSTAAAPGVVDWESFDDEIATWPLASDGLRSLLMDAAGTLRSMCSDSAKTEELGFHVAVALAEPQIAAALSAALAHVLPAESRLFAALRDVVLPDVFREPIADRVLGDV